MKRLLQLIVLGAMITAFALPALAQDPAATTTQEDLQAAKSKDYQKFKDAFDRRKAILAGDPKLEKPGSKEAYDQAYKEANQYATEYLQKYPDDKGQIPDYLKNFVAGYAKYVKQDRKNQLSQLLFKDKKYDQGFALGKQILADEPDDLLTLYNLARAGLFAASEGKENFNADTAMYAKKAIQLIDSGKSFTPGQGLAQKEKDDALGLLNYALGVATIKNTPADAVGAFIKVASIEGEAKKDAQTYYLLAAAYQGAEYEKLAADFKAQCATDEQLNSPACKAMKDRLNLVVDRIVDAYARAVSLASNPKYASKKAEWMESLTSFYKYLHDGKVDGLDVYIAGITNQPLPGPLPAAGATPAPTSSTPSTPTPPSSSGSGDGASSGTTMTPSTTSTPSSTTAPKTTPASTTPATTTPKTTAPKTTPTPKPTPKKKAHAGRH